MRNNHINYELIAKLAGYGPYCTEKPTRRNLAKLADPTVPLHERIRLLQNIAGGPLHYEEVAGCLDEDPDRVTRSKAIILAESLGDNVAGYFRFDFAAPHSPREAIRTYYQDAIDAHYTGIHAGRKALREAGVKGRTAELWTVQDLLDRYTAWVVQDERSRRWRVANGDEWMRLQHTVKRPGCAREAIEIAFEEAFPNAYRVVRVHDTTLLEPIGGVAAEAWAFDEMDRYPTWAVQKRGGYWTLASFSWQHTLNQAVQRQDN